MSYVYGVLAVFCLAAAAYFGYKLYVALKINEVLKSDRRKKSFALKMLAAVGGKKNVFVGARLPVVASPGCFVRIDYILVTRGGIIAVKDIKANGMIDNPLNGSWGCYSNANQIMPMQNPFEENEKSLQVISRLLEKNGMGGVPIYNLVMFSCGSAKFHYRTNRILSPESAVEGITQIHKKRVLTFSNVRQVVAMLKKYDISFMKSN